MNNELEPTSRKFIDKDGKELFVEIVLAFEVPELNKEYIAFTVNNDYTKEDVLVNITEVDYSTEPAKIVDIPVEDLEKVQVAYEILKAAAYQCAVEDEEEL